MEQEVENMNVITVYQACRSFKVAIQEKNSLKYILHRQYRQIDAVNNISFSIKQGEIVGFIGPNGAGKSTTIKMLTGILVPSSGSIQVLGRDPFKSRKENAREIGVVFGQRSQLWWDLPVRDTYKLLKKIYHIQDDTYEENLNTFSDILGIGEFIDQPVRQLSLGQRMRADICAALLHNPKILFLDEPTIGLDIVVKKQIRQMICEINRLKKVTVILTTHDMKDIEATCQRIILIDKGRIVVDQPTKEILHTFSSDGKIVVAFENTPEALSIPNTTQVKFDNGRYVIAYDHARNSAANIISDLTQKHKIVDVEIQAPDIDDIIQSFYQKK